MTSWPSTMDHPHRSGRRSDNLAVRSHTLAPERCSQTSDRLHARCDRQILELVPKELVVDFVMELDFLGLHEASQQLRAAIG